MASQEGQLLIDLNTKQKVFSIAVCALLNSGGRIVRMESEDRNYCFWEHGICDTNIRDEPQDSSEHPGAQHPRGRGQV
uniref:Uncharacterized protein n=1 Tax=Corvus moneduloides TaxID=1196302 RepID=A0A8C3EWR1_CORMO